MKTSARNQFSGTVKEVVIGAVNAEVHVGLKGGEKIAATVTNERRTLGLRPSGHGHFQSRRGDSGRHGIMPEQIARPGRDDTVNHSQKG